MGGKTRKRATISGRRAAKGLPFSKDNEAAKDSGHVAALKDFESKLIQDPFHGQYGGADTVGIEHLLSPPYNPYSLMNMPLQNNVLGQCIDVMTTNVVGFGHRFEYIGEEGNEGTPEAQAELQRMEDLLERVNPDDDITSFLDKVYRDYETFGYFFVEVVRDSKNELATAYHVPAHTVRITKQDREYTTYDALIRRAGKVVKTRARKRFRRYVQIFGSKRVYFKEWGDPRSIDPDTGKVSELPLEQQATEIRHVCQYRPSTAYGLPRWISQLPSILGSRESEATNLHFFKDNAIPAMAVLVSGGYLSQDTMDEIESYFTAARGRQAQNRVMVLEALSDEESASADGKLAVPKLELKSLHGERQNDELFQEYDKNCQMKVRSAFRLPPIFIGRSEDMTYAVAEASLVMAEAQVFGPERNKIDEIVNSLLLMSDGEMPKYWRFRSNPPKIVNPESITSSLNTLEALGALTPNVAIGLMNEMYNLEVDLIESDWGNLPFTLLSKMVDKGYEFEGIHDLESIIGVIAAAPTPQQPDNEEPDNDGDAPEGVDDAPEATQEAAKQTVVENLSKLVNDAKR